MPKEVSLTDKIGSKAIKPNPALKPFGFLVGEWKTAGTHPFFPDADLQGHASYEWVESGAFLMIRSEIDHPKFPDGIAIIGSDDEAGTYYMIYFDERGVSRKYNVSIKDSEIKWWRNAPKLSQRFTVTIEKDKLVSRGEMSQNGGAWEKDLSLTYTRL
jgi:hypothetical protein